MARRLADEPSPYLRQHKDNPVDWWPWCDAAFDEARRRDVPVLLSIGYATCHWCHVMAHESFEDEEVAKALNEAFVPIKVDREERPDVDEVYMQACLALNGSGGWPLTAVLDHERRPWFLGTYFPKESRGGRVGILELTERVTEAWREKRPEIASSGRHLVEHLSRPPADAGELPGPDVARSAAQQLLAREDREHGGFGGAPKFPSLHQVRLLLRAHMDGQEGALDAACRQLDAMADHGIRDLVAGGFHRYSTDRQWHLPHFEKMLYDQAMALLTYAEAHALRPSARYASVLEDTVGYLMGMRHGSGAFFAAEDADSEGEEGRFATWPWEELLSVLDGNERLARALGARPEGNHHDEATGEPVPRNILYRAEASLLDAELAEAWAEARTRLAAVRDQRVPPLRDDKVLADWNGLAAAGLAKAGQVLDRPEWTQAARDALEGAASLLGDDGEEPASLRHAWCRGQRGREVFVDDHAGLAFGHAHLAHADHDPRAAKQALRHIAAASPYAAGNGLYHRSVAEGLPARPLELHDGAIPNPNTLLAEADLVASRLLGRAPDVATGVLQGAAAPLTEHPMALTGMAGVVADLHAPHAEIVATGTMADAVRAMAHPRIHAVIAGPDEDAGRPWLDTAESAAYVCRGEACEAACHDKAELQAAVARVLGREATAMRPR